LKEDVEDWGAVRADSVIEQQESRDLMRTLIQESLDELETKVMTLHYVHELPLDTISRMLGLSNQSGAKAYIVSARRKLKRAHETWDGRTKTAKAAGNAE
jgi:DNA-directed RNA polymerase specialized sigma24 family protein